MTDFRTETFAERLERFPPFVCVALARVRNPALTAAEKKEIHWNRKSRQVRRWNKERGVTLPRRKIWRRIMLIELAERAHIGVRTLERLSVRTDWQHVSVFTMLRMTQACGLDLMRIRPQHKFMREGIEKQRAFAHLNAAQMDQFVKLWGKWKSR